MVLNGTLGRLLEMKHALVDQQKADFHQFDELLVDMKLSPADIELSLPPCFRAEILATHQERDKLLESLNPQLFDPRKVVDPATQEDMSSEQAIRLIQVHERARQGRLRAKFMQVIIFDLVSNCFVKAIFMIYSLKYCERI